MINAVSVSRSEEDLTGGSIYTITFVALEGCTGCTTLFQAVDKHTVGTIPLLKVDKSGAFSTCRAYHLCNGLTVEYEGKVNKTERYGQLLQGKAALHSPMISMERNLAGYGTPIIYQVEIDSDYHSPKYEITLYSDTNVNIAGVGGSFHLSFYPFWDTNFTSPIFTTDQIFSQTVAKSVDEVPKLTERYGEDTGIGLRTRGAYIDDEIYIGSRERGAEEERELPYPPHDLRPGTNFGESLESLVQK